MRKQHKGYLFLFFSLVALLMGLSRTGAVFAQGHTQLASPQKADEAACGAWNVVTSPNASSGPNELYGVAAVSANDVWAVGGYELYTGLEQTLVEHWNGTNWSLVPSPNDGSSYNELLGVAADSANDVWAVGDYFNGTNYQTLIEHWNGTNWSLVPSPNVASTYNFLYSVAVDSASDAWAVGYEESHGIKTLIEHWNGTKWSIVASPNPGSLGDQLFGVAADSTADAWAVGIGTGTLAEHWNGTSWSVVPSPNGGPNTNQFNGVAADSANDIWAVGFDENSIFIRRTLIEHWNGTNWSVVPSPNVGSNGNFLNGVAAVSPSDAWTVGYDYINPYYQTLIEQWNGTNWSVVPGANVVSAYNFLYGVTADSSGDVWAVGYYMSDSDHRISRTLIESYCQ